MVCIYCQKPGDLRPYGPKGAMVCFTCAMATPEREAEAKSQFFGQLEAAGAVAVVGTEAGPVPLGGGRD